MATAKDSLDKFEMYVQKMVEEYEKAKQHSQSEKVNKEPSTLHANESLDILLHNNLKLESEIEAILKKDIQYLPKDENVLLNICKEKAQQTVLETSRALDYQKELNKKLACDIKSLEQMVVNAEEVDKQLDYLINNKDEKNEYAILQNKYSKCGDIFKNLRSELNWYLSSRFSSDSLNDDLGIDEILEKLSMKFFKDPNHPYVELKEDVNSELMNYLVSSNVVIRHPTDPFQYKIADFRRN